MYLVLPKMNEKKFIRFFKNTSQLCGIECIVSENAQAEVQIQLFVYTEVTSCCIFFFSSIRWSKCKLLFINKYSDCSPKFNVVVSRYLLIKFSNKMKKTEGLTWRHTTWKRKGKSKWKSQTFDLFITSKLDSCPTLAIITVIHLQCWTLLTWHLQIASSLNTATLPFKEFACVLEWNNHTGIWLCNL